MPPACCPYTKQELRNKNQKINKGSEIIPRNDRMISKQKTKGLKPVVSNINKRRNFVVKNYIVPFLEKKRHVTRMVTSSLKGNRFFLFLPVEIPF